MAAGKKTKTPQRIYNIRPETMDFRDKMYEAIILSALADYLFDPSIGQNPAPKRMSKYKQEDGIWWC